MYRKSKGSKFMKKNKSQLSTKQEKKLRRRIKFMLWTIKVFTKENVLAAICGEPLTVSARLHYSLLRQRDKMIGRSFYIILACARFGFSVPYQKYMHGFSFICCSARAVYSTKSMLSARVYPREISATYCISEIAGIWKPA